MESALCCLAVAAKQMGIPVDVDALLRSFPGRDTKDVPVTLLRAAKRIGLKSKLLRISADRLWKMSVPSLLLFSDGDTFLYLGMDKSGDGKKVLLFHPRETQPLVWDIEELRRFWSGNVILFAKKISFSENTKKFGIDWFLPVILRFRTHLSDVFFSSFFLQTFGLITPLFTQVIIDKVLVHKGTSTLDVLVLGLVVINIFEMLLAIARTYVFSHTTNRVDVILGSKLFSHLMALPLPFFEARTVGSTVARVKELDSVRQFITGTSLTLVLDLLFTVVFIAVMFWYSAKLTLISLVALPLFAVLSVVVTPILRKRLKKKFECNAASQSYLVEMVTGIQTVKSLAIEPQLKKRWEDLLAEYVKASFRSGFLGSAASSVAQFIQKSASLAILWFGARMVMVSEITVGQLIAFQMLSGRVAEPILRLATLWQDFQQVRLSIDRLGDILNFPAEPDNAAGRASLGKIEGQVDFEHASFKYRIDGPLILDNINISVKPGTTVGIVGRSGSGKSTFTKLVQRFYPPLRGRVLVDGVDLAQIDPAWLRRQVGVVLQENFLFDGSVRDNIAVIDTAASLEEVVKAAKLAGAHDFIMELPDGYDTLVGERGSALSGGQRQRIAIARTLLLDPKILIFDEATSALDYESERIIQQNLSEICKDRTVFMIAHRLSTVQRADIILVLDRGRIVQMGTHKELIAEKGLYSFLHGQQQAIAEISDDR